MRANHFKLGLFVVISTGLFLVGVTVLGAGAMLRKTFSAETYFEESVQGLTIGSDVKYQGIKVGKITKISLWVSIYGPDFVENLDSNSYGRGIVVYLEFDADLMPHSTQAEFTDFISRSTDAGMRIRKASSGLTGPPFLALEYMDPEAQSAVTIDWQPQRTYIPWARSETRELMDSIQIIARSLEQVAFEELSEQLSTLVDELNTKVQSVDVEHITNEATSLVEELRASNRRLQEVLNNPNIDATLDSVAATMENVESIVGTTDGDLGTFVADLPEVTSRLKSTIESIDAILDDPQLQEIINNIDTASADAGPALNDVRNAARRIDRLVATQEVAVEMAIRELAAALSNIRALSEDAEQNPSRILFGDPPPRNKPGGSP